MMIVQKDNMFGPPSRERAQRLYEKNVELENRRRRSAQARVPSDPNAWQQMRENYEAIMLEDHSFSEQHNIEYALWQLHYRRIEEFRAHFSAALASASSTASQGGKGPNRPDRVTKIRLQFKTFLSEATGFYHDLILKIRAKDGLPLGYFSDDSENQIGLEKDGKRSSETKGLISCHRCLIYLGDLARYKGLYGEGDSKSSDFAAASSYYLQAASLWPSNGNSHHQLAILATYSGDEVVAVYRYFRSLAVDSPFSTARDNLIVAFEKNRQNYSQLHGDAKASAVKESPVRMTAKGRGKAEAKQPKNVNDASFVGKKESTIQETYIAFCIQFVRLSGILFTRTSLETFAEVLSLVSSALQDLLSSGPEEQLNFGTDVVENGLVIVRLISILIFSVHNVNREVESQTYADIVQRTVLLQNAFTAVFELMGHIVKRGVQLRDPSSSYLLPGIMVFVEWLASCPDVAMGSDVDDKQAAVGSFFWNYCVALLNKLLSNGLVLTGGEDESYFFDMSRYDEGETGNQLVLWEDFELRGFMPFQPAQSILDFSRKHSIGGDGSKENAVRVKRILAAGKAIASVVRVDQKTLRFDFNVKKFVIGVEPQMPDDFMFPPSSGSPKSISRFQEIPTETMMNIGVVQPKAQLYMEGEDEDEEIVFKPTVIEKRTHNEDLEPGQSASLCGGQFYGGPVPVPYGNLYMQTAFETTSQLPVSVANVVQQHLQPIQSSSSTWLLDQQASLANSLEDLSILENGDVTKPAIHDVVGISHPPPLLHTIPQSVNLTANFTSYSLDKVSETVMQSNIAFSGVISGSLSPKTSSDLSAGLRKSQLNRPVRHLGPPPGFSCVPPKQVNEPISGMDLTGENPLVDDYSWLDGYQLPFSIEGSGLNQYINQPSHSNPQYISNGNGYGRTNGFPFPGKQIPTVQFQVGKQKDWQDHQTLEHPNLHHEQKQQQLAKGSQQFIPLPEQYEGQSIWAGP